MPSSLPGVKVRNSVYWGNTPDQMGEPNTPSVTVERSDVQGGRPGACNIDLNPLFANSAAGDLRLSLTSPAIDVGIVGSDPTFVLLRDWTDVNDNLILENPITWDLDKLTRIMPVPEGGVPCHVDMGAYENQCICAVGDIDRDGDVDLQDLAFLLSCFGLPFTCADTTCSLSDVDCNGVVELQDLTYLLSDFGTVCCGGEGMMSGSDPLTEWLQSAAAEDVLDWWYAGMPPMGGDDR